MLALPGRPRLTRSVFGEALRAELGQPRQLRSVPSSPRSRVWLARLEGNPVVIKQIVDAADADHRFRREITALRLAARVDPPVVPIVLGADPVVRVLVLQRLVGRQLPEGWQLDYAATLARFHAAGRYAEPGTLPAWAGPNAADITAFLGLADVLGVVAPARIVNDLDELVQRSEHRTDQSLLHGDPCPDNLVRTPAALGFSTWSKRLWGTGWSSLPTCEWAFLLAGA